MRERERERERETETETETETERQGEREIDRREKLSPSILYCSDTNVHCMYNGYSHNLFVDFPLFLVNDELCDINISMMSP